MLLKSFTIKRQCQGQDVAQYTVLTYMHRALGVIPSTAQTLHTGACLQAGDSGGKNRGIRSSRSALAWLHETLSPKTKKREKGE